MRKIFLSIIISLCIISSSYAVDITALPDFGTPATVSDSLTTYDSSAAEGSRITEIKFSADATKVLSGTGTWISPMIYPTSGNFAYTSDGTAWDTTMTLDTDLSSVSGDDDSVPSAKATKAVLDTKYESGDAGTFSSLSVGGGAVSIGSDGVEVDTGDTYRGVTLLENTADTNVEAQTIHYTANTLYWKNESSANKEFIFSDSSLSGSNIGSGTVDEAYIDADIARDSELPTAVSELTNDSKYIDADGTQFTMYVLDDCSTASGMATGDICLEY